MKICVFVLALFNFINLKGQNLNVSADQLAMSLINLRRIADTNTTTGTGSFFECNGKYYIVTAAHVAKYMDKTAIAIIDNGNNKPVTLKLTDLALPVNWVFHKEADLAILKLNPGKELREIIKNRSIPFSAIDTSKKSVPRNVELMVFGFPLGIGVGEYFSPLTFRTHASSGFITCNRFDTISPQTVIFLENPSIGGYSGGPVYGLGYINTEYMKVSGEGAKLHGFIHGNILDSGGAMAAIVPSFYMMDFFK
ncbi:MAG: S1 family peptidase [Bacteroidia bacterium]